MPDLTGKTVVITGSTSGIGQAAAERLAAMGARIVQVARDKSRADAALARLNGSGHTVHLADLSSLSEMKRVAAEIAAAEPRIDILINNAGAMFASRGVTVDNLERTFAVNHIAYFVLTLGVLKNLTPNARIVSTSSDAHRIKNLDFDDLQSEKRYRSISAYGKSKLANILFTRELARRVKTGITANCLHPGFVSTRFAQGNSGLISGSVRFFMKFAAMSPEKGADTIVYLASSDEVAGKSGGYYSKCKLVVPSKEAQDNESADRLWEFTEYLTGVTL